MKHLRKTLLWLGMLSKRLYKMPTFLLVLFLIPGLVLGYTAISGGDSGILTIALAQEDRDPLAEQIFQDLKQSSQLVHYEICSTPESAETLLRAGKVDAVWIFPAQLRSRIEAFTVHPTASNAFITVLEREDNIALMLSREKLSGTLYTQLAPMIYVSYLRQLAPELAQLSDQELLTYYDSTQISDQLFAFDDAAAQPEQTHYLLSPLRGMLGVIVVLCALSTSMYYIRDTKRGTFSWLSQRWQFMPELGCQLVAVTHVAAAALICLALCGLSGSLGQELTVLVLYSLCCACFAMALRRLCGSIRVLGTLLPVLMVIMLVICPVFFDLGSLRRLQFFFPPTYYINAIYNDAYLGYMVLYTLACFGTYLLAGKLLRKR